MIQQELIIIRIVEHRNIYKFQSSIVYQFLRKRDKAGLKIEKRISPVVPHAFGKFD